VGWGDHVPVIAAETEGADCLATSIDQGEVTMPKPYTLHPTPYTLDPKP